MNATLNVSIQKKAEAKAASIALYRPRSAIHPTHSGVGQLQKAIGNREVQRLYKAGILQTSLKIGQPNDGYEQEADRVAEQVMRMPEPLVQKKCRCSSGGQPCAKCAEEKEKLNIRRKTDSSATSVSMVPDNIVSSLGVGQPLDKATRDYFEPRFGMDFSQIRVHKGSKAEESASSIKAYAYTLGNNVVFGRGQYQPQTIWGKRLLAHELTHTIQQVEKKDTLRRFATCEAAGRCPRRDSGEVERVRRTPHRVETYQPAIFGILISNFPIDGRNPKTDLHSNLTWIRLVANMGTTATDEWEILGFSDCQGPEARNNSLRQERANEIASVLPSAVRVRVRRVSAATISDCIDSNGNEPGRSRNRSVLIRRIPGSTGPTAPPWSTPVGPIRLPGSPGNYCVPYTGFGATLEARAARTLLENVWLSYANGMFGREVHNLWRDYLNRPKGAPLTPRIFSGAGNPIVNAFRTDPETIRHQGLLNTEIVAAAARTPEANIPLTGTAYTSPPIPLGTLLPATSLTRTINYTDPATRIPGNIAGGTGVIGTASSDAGPDLRLFTGNIQIIRTQPSPGSPEVKSVRILLQLQVIDAVDFCPGAAGGSWAQTFTIPMSRLEATPTEPTYDLPFHVFVDLSSTVTMP